jgi:hypothetical protein
MQFQKQTGVIQRYTIDGLIATNLKIMLKNRPTIQDSQSTQKLHRHYRDVTLRTLTGRSGSPIELSAQLGTGIVRSLG